MTTTNLQEVISNYSKVAGYKINIQVSIVVQHNTKAQSKRKIYKLDFIKMKTFCYVKDNAKRRRKQAMHWENIFAKAGSIINIFPKEDYSLSLIRNFVKPGKWICQKREENCFKTKTNFDCEASHLPSLDFQAFHFSLPHFVHLLML